MKITAHMSVQEALKISKHTIKVFNKYNLDCPSCKGGEVDTIEKVALNNGLDVNQFLQEINGAPDS